MDISWSIFIELFRHAIENTVLPELTLATKTFELLNFGLLKVSLKILDTKFEMIFLLSPALTVSSLFGRKYY